MTACSCTSLDTRDAPVPISSLGVFSFCSLSEVRAVGLAKQEPHSSHFLPPPWNGSRQTASASVFAHERSPSAIHLQLNEEKHISRQYSCDCSAYSYPPKSSSNIRYALVITAHPLTLQELITCQPNRRIYLPLLSPWVINLLPVD